MASINRLVCPRTNAISAAQTVVLFPDVSSFTGSTTMAADFGGKGRAVPSGLSKRSQGESPRKYPASTPLVPKMRPMRRPKMRPMSP